MIRPVQLTYAVSCSDFNLEAEAGEIFSDLTLKGGAFGELTGQFSRQTLHFFRRRLRRPLQGLPLRRTGRELAHNHAA